MFSKVEKPAIDQSLQIKTTNSGIKFDSPIIVHNWVSGEMDVRRAWEISPLKHQKGTKDQAEGVASGNELTERVINRSQVEVTGVMKSKGGDQGDREALKTISFFFEKKKKRMLISKAGKR